MRGRVASERFAQLKAELEADPDKADRARQPARLRAAHKHETRVAVALARCPRTRSDQAPPAQGSLSGARLDDRCKGDGHEDGRRRVSARVPPAVGQRCRLAGDRGRRGGHGLKLSGSDGADDRAGARALRSGARGLLGRWPISGTVTSRSTKPAHTKVYEPVPATNDRTVAPHQPNPKDSPGVASWRARMVPDEAKVI